MPEMRVVGMGEVGDGTLKWVVNGGFIFALVDTHGLPLDMINLTLRQHRLAFDVVGFAVAALKSWPAKRIFEVLKAAMPDCNENLIKAAIGRAANA